MITPGKQQAISHKHMSCSDEILSYVRVFIIALSGSDNQLKANMFAAHLGGDLQVEVNT